MKKDEVEPFYFPLFRNLDPVPLDVPNLEEIRYVENLGHHLIEKVTISVGGLFGFSQTWRNCPLCKNVFTYEEGQIEWNLVWRKLRGGKGDLTVCIDCDRKKKEEVSLLERLLEPKKYDFPLCLENGP